MVEWQFEAIGTAWQIDTLEPIPSDVQAEVATCVESFDRVWSRFRPDSLVTDMSQRAGVWELPDEADVLFDFYDELHDMTDGAVNPLIGEALSGLGYDAGYSLRPTGDVVAVPPWDSVIWGDGVITTSEPVILDIGAAGKGLLVDLVEQIVGAWSRQFSVDASGDIYYNFETPLRVGLEHPHDPTRAIGVAELGSEAALCASATNRRVWGEGLHHVLDGRTGRPTGDVIATWVVAPQSCMHADGLATAYFFADPEVLAGCYPHEFVRMFADGRIEWSPNFPGELFV